MKKLSFLFISLLTAFAFTGCTDGLDNIEYIKQRGDFVSSCVGCGNKFFTDRYFYDEW